ncbi:hypothetical protein Clacol_000597 [Clathrus columnatus]|uniref:Uncharacterized protein n=1 Tax=Clathrus columnatus TaxID=1419009 RepID=A0AAV4ZWS6_9AGAM|nr:hypothetical protein Clacol_000597 [Clathrus columnatus]
MTLNEEQLQHERINLGRLLKRLETSIDQGMLNGSNLLAKENAWTVVQGVAQVRIDDGECAKLKYAKESVLHLETSDSSNSQLPYLQAMRNTLDKLDEILELANKQVEYPSCDDVDYLSLVSLPPQVENIVTTSIDTSKLNIMEDTTSAFIEHSPEISTIDQIAPTPSSQSPVSLLPSLPRQDSTLSSSLKTHEALSDELARMAAQLRRNAEHFSVTLEKDKGLVVAAEEVLLKNADNMSREHDRLSEHSSKSFSTTWFTIGAILVVCITWVWMFFVIRVT